MGNRLKPLPVLRGQTENVTSARDDLPSKIPVNSPEVASLNSGQMSGFSVTFETREGPSVDVFLSERPLGLRFTGAGPMIVTAVHQKMHAADRGIEIDWRVTHIDGGDVQNVADVQVRKLFKEKCRRLANERAD